MIRRYVVSLVVMLALDAVWLGLTMGPLYQRQLGHLLAPQVSITPAIVFYLIYGGAVVLLTRQGEGWRAAWWRGLVLGLAAYGTYDLTNQATMRDWPVVVTLADMVWGSALTATAAAAGAVLGGRKAG